MIPASKTKGFSLIEIIVFVSVFSVAIVSIIGSVTYSAILLNDARNKLMATRLSEELAEWLKYKREFDGYSVIKEHASVTTKYCFNVDDFDDWPETGECGGDNYGLNNFYKRELTLAYPPPHLSDETRATIVTSWRFLNTSKQVSLTIIFNDYGL